jgi:hypothetical protein
MLLLHTIFPGSRFCFFSFPSGNEVRAGAASPGTLKWRVATFLGLVFSVHGPFLDYILGCKSACRGKVRALGCVPVGYYDESIPEPGQTWFSRCSAWQIRYFVIPSPSQQVAVALVFLSLALQLACTMISLLQLSFLARQTRLVFYIAMDISEGTWSLQISS